MPNIRFMGFGGERPSVDPRYLPDNGAQKATNVFLTSGRIDPTSEPTTVGKLRFEVCKSIYEADTNIWFSWDSDTDVARSPIANDSYKRFYFSSIGFEPRVTTLNMATDGAQAYPKAWYALGVVPPSTKPNTSVAATGSGTNESRIYCYTFVSDWGEESAPSPSSTILTGLSGAVWTVSGLQVPPVNSGNITAATFADGIATLTLNSTFGLREQEVLTLNGPLAGEYRIKSVDTAANKVQIYVNGITGVTTGTWARSAPHNVTAMKKRIYRSVTSASGTDFYFVAEIDGSVTSFTDTVSGSTLGEPLATLGWDMPPADLQGMAVLPCGALVGFSGNEICFSEPLTPYAWPQSYRITTDYKIVAIGLLGTTIIVGTTGQPYVINGLEPASMTSQRLDQAWPCLNKRGMTAFNNAVYYPTTAGLAMVSASGSSIATSGLYTQREWTTTNPHSFVAGFYDNKYYASTNLDGSNVVLIISPGDSVSTLNSPVDALFSNPRDGYLYAAYKWNALRLGTTEGMALGGEWRSKRFVLPKPGNIGAAKVEAQFAMTPEQAAAVDEYNASIAATNASLFLTDKAGPYNSAPLGMYTFDGSDMKPVTAAFSQKVQFRLYADGKLIFTKDVTNERAFKLPAGNKYYNFEVGIYSNIPVYAVVLGDTAKSLEQV